MEVFASAFKFPMVRILVPFVLGIVASSFINSFVWVIIGIFSLLLIASVFFAFLYKKNYGSRLIIILFYLVVFLLAFPVTEFHKPTIILETAEATRYLKIIDEPKIGAKTVKVQAEVLFSQTDSIKVPQHAKVALYLARDSAAENLQIGNELVAQFACDSIKNSGNPFEFDFAGYMARQAIFYSAYVPEHAWELVPTIYAKSVKAYAIEIRNYLADIYKRNNISGNELGVLSALTLGYKADLDPAVQQSYVSSGTMHVLAVSGLHVGVIFIILQALVRIPPSSLRNRLLKLIIIVSMLWFFAFITGFSASVNRAALMFSMVQLGLAFNRRSAIYNTLAGSAFLLLLINPNYLYNVGFQLSYIAVFSIVYLQPKIEQVWHFNNKFIQEIWVLFTVSLAAQIGTAPISMYYFGIFPMYFWVANIPIVPLSSVVMYSAVALLSVSWVEYLSEYVAVLANIGVWLMNSITDFVGKLPFAVWQGINVSGVEVFVFYAVILLLIVWRQYRKSKYFLWFTGMVALWLAVVFFQQINNKPELVVFNSKKASVWCIKHKTQALMFTDKPDEIAYLTSGYLKKSSISSPQYVDNDSVYANTGFAVYKKPFAKFAGKIIVHISKRTDIVQIANQAIPVDYAIITGNPDIEMEYLLEFCKPELVIIDAANYKTNTEVWKKDLLEKQVAYYDVQAQGAFIRQF